MDIMRRLGLQWERSIAALAVVAGGVSLLLGYLGSSKAALAPEQIPYLISGGIGGIFFLGIGATLWLSADLRDEWVKLDRVEQILREAVEEETHTEPDRALAMNGAPM